MGGECDLLSNPTPQQKGFSAFASTGYSSAKLEVFNVLS